KLIRLLIEEKRANPSMGEPRSQWCNDVENCDRAMKLAHKLSMQLRAAEERISQLEAEVELFRDRAARAEGWLQTIQKRDRGEAHRSEISVQRRNKDYKRSRTASPVL